MSPSSRHRKDKPGGTEDITILGGEEKADSAEQKGPKADQAAGRLSLRFTLVEFTSRGSDLLVGLYFLFLTANMT